MAYRLNRSAHYARIDTRGKLLDDHEVLNDSLRKWIADLQSTIEDQAFAIHVHEKSLDEYAATVCTREMRDATLRKVDAL